MIFPTEALCASWDVWVFCMHVYNDSKREVCAYNCENPLSLGCLCLSLAHILTHPQRSILRSLHKVRVTNLLLLLQLKWMKLTKYIYTSVKLWTHSTYFHYMPVCTSTPVRFREKHCSVYSYTIYFEEQDQSIKYDAFLIDKTSKCYIK